MLSFKFISLTHGTSMIVHHKIYFIMYDFYVHVLCSLNLHLVLHFMIVLLFVLTVV